MTYIITALILNCFINAQNTGRAFPSDIEMLTQHGNLVSVRIVKGEPIKIFVFEKEAAEIDFSGARLGAQFVPVDLSLNVRQIGAKKISRILKLKRENDYFVIRNPDSTDKSYTLEVTTKVKDKKEVFIFKVENNLH